MAAVVAEEEEEEEEEERGLEEGTTKTDGEEGGASRQVEPQIIPSSPPLRSLSFEENTAHKNTGSALRKLVQT